MKTLAICAIAGTIAALPLQSASALTPEELTQQGLRAGAGYPGLAANCTVGQPRSFTGSRPRSGQRRRLTPEERAARRAAAYVDPVKVFDNLYFVGNRSVTGWAITTREGIILIDAMNNNDEARRYIETGLIKLGLDPNDIKYLVIAHAHGDHYGGQQYLVETYAPRVVMSEEDWTELEKPVQEFNSPRWGEPPQRDMSVKDGHRLKLGDTTIRLYVTPGHTPGTLSMIFPVKDGDATHMVALWGGTGMRFGNDADRMQTYADSAARMRQLAEEAGVDIFMSNHPRRDGAVENIAKLPQRGPDDPHPFVSGTAALGAFDLLRDCAQARADDARRKL